MRMIGTNAEKVIRWRSDRALRRVNRIEQDVMTLDDEALRDRVRALRQRREQGAELDDLAVEMFALVREATRRTIGIRQYDIQVCAGAALGRGAVIQMNTGEGKTFVAPLASCLHALDRRGVHILTANDYLAGRDHALLEPVYSTLGFSCSVVLSDSNPSDRAAAYRADITYTTVHQLGFDFLRQYFDESPDRLRERDLWSFLHSDIDGSTPERRALRGRYCAILDEVDSILIDYARAPLSMTVEARVQRTPETYHTIRNLAVGELRDTQDYTINRAHREIELTEEGRRKIGDFQHQYRRFRLLDAEWEELLKSALMGEYLFRRDEHYVVRDGQVVLIDQTSGRLMRGQRLGGELHQLLETKENVAIQPRGAIAKKISIQALMRPYEHLAGMTGTAWEARQEFLSVYDMPTIRFEPRIPLKRHVNRDLFFSEGAARWERVADDIRECHDRGQPVLVGVQSVEESRQLSEMLTARQVSHDVLNAVDHAREARIIAEAGQRGRVTVAARLAGRGVEIKLGEGVADLGGLHVIGAERLPLRRYCDQLAGRCGRHGAPGSVQFYASLDDEVFQALSERERRQISRRLASKNGAGRHAPELDRAVARAQGKYAAHYAAIRKALFIEELAQERADRTLFGQQKL